MSKMVMILNLLCHVDVKTMGFLDKALNKAKELDEKQREYFEKEKEKNEIKKQEKERIKDGEDIIKRIMGSNMMRNVQFNNQIINQGVSTFKINSVWGKVNKQIKKELHEGTVELRDIPERINQILAQYANPEKIEKKNKKIQRELVKAGVEDRDFSCVLYEERRSGFNNKKENLVKGFCYVNEDKLVIKKLSFFKSRDLGDKVIPYGNINAIDYDKQVVGRTSGIVISVSGFKPIVLQGATDENFQLLNDAWLNFNKKSNESVQKIVETNTLTNADELLKYAELYEKGLLTDEEFAAMKKKIIEK
ncbi:SHOCT domain-containing protein [Methanobrevibacter smithii]|uniref:SHOCT domain-containing protein n=1 Tax=Methanobrevibacter smithii TaxID=2173 RepID=UPI0037DD631F